MDTSPRKEIEKTSIKWLFFSDKGGDKIHYWGKHHQSYVKSTRYPKETKRMVKKIMKSIKSSCVLTSPTSLVPVYDHEGMRLGKHKDRFHGKPEYVINVYLGDERYLTVMSDDNEFETKVICKQGLIRIFHPLFNSMFWHEKKRSNIPRGIHYALSIRQGETLITPF